MEPKTHRCTGCNRILAKSDCINAEIICKCKTVNVIRYFTDKALMKLRIIDTPATG